MNWWIDEYGVVHFATGDDEFAYQPTWQPSEPEEDVEDDED